MISTKQRGDNLSTDRNVISQSGTAGECLSLCFIVIVVAAIAIILMTLTGCSIESTALQHDEQSKTPDATIPPTVEVYGAPDTNDLHETPDTSQEAPTPTPPIGETELFEYSVNFIDERLPFSVELTNVISAERKTATLDDGNQYGFPCYILSPGAKLSVINADMNDGNLTDNGQPYPQWYIETSGDKIPITEDMTPLEITDDMTGIYSEGVVILFFEFQS